MKFKEMMEWGKELKQPILNTLEQKYYKDSLEIFKLIQIFMNDRPTIEKKKHSHVAQQIISIGITIPQLRDETYCQISKQITRHPIMFFFLFFLTIYFYLFILFIILFIYSYLFFYFII